MVQLRVPIACASRRAASEGTGRRRHSTVAPAAAAHARLASARRQSATAAASTRCTCARPQAARSHGRVARARQHGQSAHGRLECHRWLTAALLATGRDPLHQGRRRPAAAAATAARWCLAVLANHPTASFDHTGALTKTWTMRSPRRWLWRVCSSRPSMRATLPRPARRCDAHHTSRCGDMRSML